MKKRSLLAVVIGLSLVSFNYSLAYFSNELLLEDNTISIGEFETLEDKDSQDNSEEELENNDENIKNNDEIKEEIIEEDLKNNDEQKNSDEILEDETTIENIEKNENSALKNNEINNVDQGNMLSE